MELRINTEETNIDDLKQVLEIVKKAIERRNADKTQKELPISTQEPEPTLSLEPQVEQPIPEQTIEQEPTTPPPSVDISALAMSDYGQEKENRSMGNLAQETTQPEPSQPQLNERDAVLEIITNLKRKNPDGPLYMQNIISLSNAKGISEEKARQLVSQLKEEGSI